MSTTRTYNGYLLVDWRDDSLRFRKTKPSKGERSPTEYPVKIELQVEVPKFDVPTLAAELDVPEAQVKRAAHDDLFDGDETPQWHETVEHALEHFPEEVNEVVVDPSGVRFDDTVTTLVGFVLRNAEGYPDPDAVVDHVENRLYEVVQ